MLQADHDSNASTFTARIAIGAGAEDFLSAISAAISTFSGVLHGGAIEKVMSMLREIKEPIYAATYIKSA